MIRMSSVRRLVKCFNRSHYKHPECTPEKFPTNAETTREEVKRHTCRRRITDRVGDGDETGLREKYLHSQGAALYDEGRFDEAIDFFERAIALDDQPYTRYHLMSDVY